MKSSIILQHFDGTIGDLERLSIDNISSYAKVIGADYELITGKPFRQHLTPPCQKVYMLDERFDKWENVLMVDIDMFTPKNMTANVFDEVGVGIHNYMHTKNRASAVRRFPSVASLSAPYWGGAIYKMNRYIRQQLRSNLGENEDWMEFYNNTSIVDEGIMHTLAFKAGLDQKNMYIDNKWCQCSYLPNPENAGFIHIRTKISPSGPKRKKIENYNELVESGII